MANDKFSIKEALQYGWSAFKANVPFFIGLLVVIGLLTVVPDMIADRLFAPRSAGLVISKILLRLVGLILGMVTTRVALDIHDHGAPDLSKLGELPESIFPYVVGKVLYGLMVLIGLILLIIPGLVVAYMFLYVGFLIIDRKLGALAALGESRVITDGYKMDLFLFSLVVALLNIVGVLCVFVGLFVTIPTTMMASAYVYRRLSPAEPAAETA